ncbi:MAG: hypothetical protein HUK21_07740 [Fibrobacteraceae bacterium]|nr:hypothetical protein [Fibrobacteraceae bacterium]
MRVILTFILIALGALGYTGAFAASISEAQVFEWWDNGIIVPDEAEELLQLLEEGDMEEACLRAEVYALESCDEYDPSENVAIENDAANNEPQKTKKAPQREEIQKVVKRGKKQEGLNIRGYVLYKGRTDSLGHLKSHRTELNISFYRYNLKLGKQELLTYKNQGAEAYFGEISTKELHSHFPLDTFWGTALRYPMGHFYIGSLIDTSGNYAIQTGANFFKDFAADVYLWQRNWPHFKSSDSIEYSGALQTKFPNGRISLWHKFGGDAPLVKIQLQNSSSNKEDSNANSKADSKKNIKKDYEKFSWKTTAYAHGDDIPPQANLSSTLIKNRLWASQTFTYSSPSLLNFVTSTNLRILSPMHRDSISARAQQKIQFGPPVLETGISATCMELNDQCKDYSLKLQTLSQWDQYLFLASGKIQHLDSKGLTPLHLEFGGTYAVEKSRAKLVFILPNCKPRNEIQIRNESVFVEKFLEFSLTTTFRKTQNTDFHPIHGAFFVKFLF